MKQPWWGCFKSRLSRKIARVAFFSILTVEGIVFVPQYLLREQEQLTQLRTDRFEPIAAEVQTQLQTDTAQAEQDQNVLATIKAQIEQDALIAGGALYRRDRALIQTLGEPPQLKNSAIAADRPKTKLHRSQDRYDVLVASSEFQGEYSLVLRFKTENIRQTMVAFTQRKLITVLLVSGLLSLILLLILQKLLMRPVYQLKDDLTAAGDAASKENTPLFYTFSQSRKDELGDVAIAFCQMYHRIRHAIRDRRRAEEALIHEQEKADRLLLNVLPGAIAKRLKEESGAIASRFDEVTILFADIVGFTHLASQMTPLELITQLNGIFSAFDKLTESYGLEKIKTIGDAYMIVGGVPTPRSDHAIAILEIAIEMLAVTQEFRQPDGQPFQLRIGISTGPVIAGVIGRKKFSYDLWGDAVNLASRMESQGIVGKIQVAPSTYERLRHIYRFEERSKISIKNVGKMDTYLYSGRRTTPTASQARSSVTD